MLKTLIILKQFKLLILVFYKNSVKLLQIITEYLIKLTIKMKQNGNTSPNALNSFRRSVVLPDIFTTYSPKNFKVSTNLIDCGLTRTDVLAQDRNKHALNLLNRRQSKDISYFYENIRGSPPLPLMRDLSYFSLPSNLEDLKILNECDEYRPENLLTKGKNQPSSRKDAENLAEWLEEMQHRYLSNLETLIENKEIIDEDTLFTAETIFMMAFKEAVKHTATSCLPRAHMLLKVFETLSYIWKKSNYLTERKIEEIKNKYFAEISKSKSDYEERLFLLTEKIEELQKQISAVNKENELLQNEASILKRHLTKPKTEPPKPKSETIPLQLRMKQQLKHKYVQTEIEESLDESSSEDLQVLPSVLSTEQLLSRQGTMAQEKSIQQISFLKSKFELFDCIENFNLDELYAYITKDFCDFYAWVDGFRVSFEFYKKKLEEKKDQPAPATILSQPVVRTEEKKKSFKDPKAPQQKFKANMTTAQYISETSPIEQILQQFAGQNLKKIEKHSKMAYKKLLVQVSNYLNLSRVKGLEQFTSFAVFVYSELFQKYSIKQFANRKFKELIACCVKYSNIARIQIFLRMLGGGQCIGLSSFSLNECKLILKSYDFMYSDKTGIMTDTESADPVLFPAARAIECIKQILEGLIPKSQLNKQIRTVEEMSKTDPINRLGVIDIHSFVLKVAESYHQYIKESNEAIKLIVNVLTEENSLTLGELHLLLRKFSGKKDLKTAQLDHLDVEIIEIDDLCEESIGKGLLRPSEIHKYFGTCQEVVVEKVQEVKEKVSEVLESIQDVCTLSLDEWESKLDDVLIWSKGKNAVKAARLWGLLISEYTYLMSLVSVPEN